MKSRRTNFGYFLIEGIRGIFKHAFMSFAAVVIILACLVILGSFTMVLVNINSLMERLESENEVIAYVDESLSDAQARSIGSTLNLITNISSVEFTTREQAMESFIARYEDPKIFDGLDPDTFRHRYVIGLTSTETMSETVGKIRAVEGIADVNALSELESAFATSRSVLRIVTIVIGAVLVVISLFIISNTIKMSTFNRREEISIMKTVGATNAFIRRPFVYQGTILGILGAAAAFFAQWGLYNYLSQAIVSADTTKLLQPVPFDEMLPYVAVAFGVVGFLVGVIGSANTIRKYLKV